MKTIGLLGGMSWESTQDYYRLLNRGVRKRLGGNHSAKIILLSVDFQSFEDKMQKADWPAISSELIQYGKKIEEAGAAMLLICTNTMHKCADEVAAALTIPLLHIADASAEQMVRDGRKRLGLLGTRFTMEEDFYQRRLALQYNIDVLTPRPEDRQEIDRIIFEELCQGKISKSSKMRYLEIIHWLKDQGAEAVILGCTEIGMLVKQDDTAVPLYDTTALHAASALKHAFEK